MFQTTKVNSMATIESRTLFFFTSPRSPYKLIPEIKLLIDELKGEKWNKQTQIKFADLLQRNNNFNNVGKAKDPAFTARDRITRAPKALGFVDLKPTIQLTEAGSLFLDEETRDEAFLRQILKFQLPSPYHREAEKISHTFCVKPYLEIFRLIEELEQISFDELRLFGMQLTSYKKFNLVKDKILKFREDKKNSTRKYSDFYDEYMKNELIEIYKKEITSGDTKTRESASTNLNKFINTKISNLRDYADACVRALNATGYISISQKGKTISIYKNKLDDVRYFLKNTERNPIFLDNEIKYKEYLFNASIPKLSTDNRKLLERKLLDKGIMSEFQVQSESLSSLKKALRIFEKNRKLEIIKEQTKELKTFKEYNDVLEVFDDIQNKNFFDVPLMFEWNTWRAMTMLDGGDIKANLNFDGEGKPLSTAPGNQADIICDYEGFSLAVEVTMSGGNKQYEMEGEPVARHLAKLKKEKGKAYCLFIAPKINEASIAHFYLLYKENINYYGGTSTILPLKLDTFKDMLIATSKVKYVPNSSQIEKLCKLSQKLANSCSSEVEWFSKLQEQARNWLTIQN